jgi:hypothetical protein
MIGMMEIERTLSLSRVASGRSRLRIQKSKQQVLETGECDKVVELIMQGCGCSALAELPQSFTFLHDQAGEDAGL